MTPYTFRDARHGDESAVQLVVESVLREYGMPLDLADIDSDLVDIMASYSARGGAFRVLTDPAGRIAGCGGLFPLGDHEAEIRKMYLLPEARGHGLGRSLLQGLVDAARANGVPRLSLETRSAMERAIALYRAFGFTEIVSEHQTPRCDRAFVLDLDDR